MKKTITIIATVTVIAVAVAILFTQLNNKPTVKKDNTDNKVNTPSNSTQNVDTAPDINVNPYFDATVEEVTKNSIILTPLNNQSAVTGYNKLEIPTVLNNGNAVTELKDGDVVRVIFNGQIAKSSPGKINIVFAVYLLDKNGDPIL